MKLSIMAAVPAFVALSLAGSPAVRAQTASQVQHIIGTFTTDAIRSGRAIGIGVGVVFPGQPLHSYARGLADPVTRTPFTIRTLCGIASTSKVFTTNLLGQRVAAGQLSLATNLGQLAAAVGPMPPLTRQVTLEELADFTAGMPTLPPLCSNADVPGCMPNIRPVLTDYTAADFLTFVRNTTLSDYTVSPALPLTALPGPSWYSDMGVGLLGLILGSPAKTIHNGAVGEWFNEVNARILTPLRMTGTYLTVPSTVSPSLLAGGYALATAVPTLTDGGLSKIQLTVAGQGYNTAPAVAIIGGGGTGAVATATVAAGLVTHISIQSPGRDYLPPPVIAFGARPVVPAVGTAIVSGGRIAGVLVTNGGGGYRTPPLVTVTGGRRAHGRDAQLVAHVANGAVTAVTVQDGGAGYVEPLAVAVAPGVSVNDDVVPIWAPAGALVSSTADLTSFAAAAVGRTIVNGHHVPAELTQGFAIAETAYQCGAKNKTFPDCGAALPRNGLAWSINPPDTLNGVPQMLSRTGGLNGFTNQMVLVPDKQLAVVVMVNSHGDPRNGNLGYHIAYALLAAMAENGGRR